MKKLICYQTIPVLVLLILALAFQSCKKKPTLSVVSTTAITGIMQTSAASGGNISSDGGAEITSRGVCWGTSQNPSVSSSKTNDGKGTGSFTSSISGLTAGIKYYVRAYAVNSVGTSYGSEVSFSTTPVAQATLSTAAIGSVTAFSAASGGNITSDGGGAITARGVCWSKSQNPTVADSKTSDGSGTGSFTSSMTNLSSGTLYYVRAYATNSAGTAYGDEKSFSTSQIKDADGNTYTTVTIGTQIWMVENLKTTKYNDGTAISNLTEDDAWANATSGGYCWYNNDISYKNPYGALYNWYATSTDKLCPAGWHVPLLDEWNALIDYLGGVTVAGDKMKEQGTEHWDTPNIGATNESGLTLLPGGLRETYGLIHGLGHYGDYFGDYFTATRSSYVFGVNSISSEAGISPNTTGNWVTFGCSVRCIKD